MNIFHPLFWFSLEAANVGGLLGKMLLAFFLLLILVGVVCRMVLMHSSQDRYVKMVVKRMITFCLTMGFLGLLLYFFSYQGIQLFGARFWYPLWDLGAVVWIVSIAKFALKEVPRLREKNMVQSVKSKYIPGRKK